ncbi:unnamed protein product [Lampetra fluviatilis]
MHVGFDRNFLRMADANHRFTWRHHHHHLNLAKGAPRIHLAGSELRTTETALLRPRAPVDQRERGLFWRCDPRHRRLRERLMVVMVVVMMVVMGGRGAEKGGRGDREGGALPCGAALIFWQEDSSGAAWTPPPALGTAVVEGGGEPPSRNPTERLLHVSSGRRRTVSSVGIATRCRHSVAATPSAFPACGRGPFE